MKILLFSLVLCFGQLLTAQIPFFHQHMSPFLGNKVAATIIDNQLYQSRKNAWGHGAAVCKYDANWNFLKEEYKLQASDVWVDDAGNSYFFTAWDQDTDVPYNYVNFSLDKYNADLELVSNTYLLDIERISQGNIGRIQPLPNGNLLLFYSNFRIIYDIDTEEFIQTEEDIQLDVIVKTSMLSDTSILVQTHENNDFYITDLSGIVKQTIELDDYKDWLLFDEHFLAIKESQLFIFNNNFESIGSFDFDDAIDHLHVSDDEVRFSAAHTLHALSADFSATNEIWNNNFSRENIFVSYDFNDELGLFLEEDLSALPDPKFSGVTTRKAFALSEDQLPDIALNDMTITPVFRDTEIVYTGEILFRLDLQLDLAVENLGDEAVNSIFELDFGNCYPFPFRPNYCHAGLSNTNIPAGNSATVTLISYDWDWTTKLDLDFDVCVTLENPNFNYDKDYSNNHLCKEVFISNTENKIKPEKQASLVPNPAMDFTTISFHTEYNEAAELIILDSQNKLITQESIQITKGYNDYSINTAGFAAGLHLIMIKGKKQTYLARLMKSN